MSGEDSGARAGAKGSSKQRVMILGNCVADRLQYFLREYPGFSERYSHVPAPMIHLLREPAQWEETARQALACDLILTQPLFNYGPCNTDALRAGLKDGRRLAVFSSPNFEAYFPDAVAFEKKDNLTFPSVLDWDSRIIFSCFLAGVSIFQVEELYRAHPMFHRDAVRKRIADALEQYALREKGLDISTGLFVLRNYAKTRLFHSPRHPVDSFLGLMAADIGAYLGLERGAFTGEIDGFGFNQWPVITKPHSLFAFEEQAYFMIGGRRFSIEDVAMAYYSFYASHPHVVEANRHRAVAV